LPRSAFCPVKDPMSVTRIGSAFGDAVAAAPEGEAVALVPGVPPHANATRAAMVRPAKILSLAILHVPFR